jgi:hypothetical protein
MSDSSEETKIDQVQEVQEVQEVPEVQENVVVSDQDQDQVQVQEVQEPIPEDVVVSEKKDIFVKMHDFDETIGNKSDYPQVSLKNNPNTIGLDDELPQDILDSIKEQVLKNLELANAYDEDLNLDEDLLKVPKQNYAVISFVGPKLTAKTDIYGLRLMGAFDTIEEAQDHILAFKKNEKSFDTCIVELYKWIPSYPDSNDTSQKDVDTFLNKLIIDYKTVKEEKKVTYEERKKLIKANKKRYIEKEVDPDLKEKLQARSKEEIEIKDPKDKGKDKDKVLEDQDQDQVQDLVTAPVRDKTHARLIERLNQRRKKFNEEQNAKKDLTKDLTKDLNLEKSRNRVFGQNFAAITYVGNTGSNKRTAIKIKGFFDDYDSCSKHCKDLMTQDDTYDILICEMYSWIPCDPETDSIKHIYNDEKLNEMFKAHEEETSVTSKFHKDRSIADKNTPTILNHLTEAPDTVARAQKNNDSEIQDNLENEDTFMSGREYYKKQ